MGPTRGPSGSCRPQMGLMLAPWTLLSGMWCYVKQTTLLEVKRTIHWRPSFPQGFTKADVYPGNGSLARIYSSGGSLWREAGLHPWNRLYVNCGEYFEIQISLDTKKLEVDEILPHGWSFHSQYHDYWGHGDSGKDINEYWYWPGIPIMEKATHCND